MRKTGFVIFALALPSFATAQTSDDFQTAITNAKAHLLVGDSNAAIADLNAVIDPNQLPDKVCGKVGSIFLTRAEIFLAVHRYRDALEDTNRGLKCESENSRARFDKGQSYFGLGDANSAIAAYSEAIGAKPDYTEAYKNRGKNYENLRQFDKALADYAQVLQLKPDDAETYNNRATILFATEKFDAAIADYSKALSIDPTNSMTFLNRANAYFSLAQYDKSRDDLASAEKLFDHDKVDSAYIQRVGNVAVKHMDYLLAVFEERLHNAPGPSSVDSKQ